MNTWRASAVITVLLFAGLASVAFVPWLAQQYRRYGRLRGWPAAVSAAVGLYACGLIAFTLFPLPANAAATCDRAGSVQLVPFASFVDAVHQHPDRSVVGWLVSAAVLQLVLNVVLFLPLGFLARYRFGLRVLPVVLLGLLVSVAIETVQGTAVFGIYSCPYRIADVDDVLTNTLGAALGALLAGPLGRRLPNPRPAPIVDLDPPRPARRLVAVLTDVFAAVVVAGLATAFLAAGLLAAPGGSPLASSAAFERGRSAIGYAVPVLLFLLLPLLGRHRAPLGQAAVGLTVVRTGGRPAPRAIVLLRNAVRWGILAVLNDLDLPAAIVGWVVVLLLVAALSPGHRSLAGLLTGTVTTTRTRAASTGRRP